MTTNATFIAAVLAIGADAALSHDSSGGLWAFARSDGLPHVTVARRVRPRADIHIHTVRALDAQDVTRHRGIWTTTPARTLLDLAGVVPERALRRAVHEAQVQRRVNQRQLEEQVGRAAGRREATLLRRMIEDGPAPTRSELEDRTLELLEEYGFPRPLTNVRVDDVPGRPEVDFLFPELRLVVEADGHRYHDTPFRRREDATKQANVEAHGYRVVPRAAARSSASTAYWRVRGGDLLGSRPCGDSSQS